MVELVVSIGAGVGLVDARHIAHIRAPLRLLVDNSTVRANQALVFVALSLVQLSDAAIDAWLYPTATLAVHVTNGSVLSLATQLTTWEDVCSLVSCVDVHSNLSSALQLRVDGGSSVSINCATIATFLMLAQTTGISFMADVANTSIVLLCRANTHFSKTLQTPTGAGLLYMTNALAHSAAFAVASSSIACGAFFCTLVGSYAQTDALYNTKLRLILDMQTIPPAPRRPRLVNSSIALANIALLPVSPWSPLPQLRLPMINFANMSDVTVSLAGPSVLDLAMFQALAGVNGASRPSDSNQLALWACEQIALRDGAAPVPLSRGAINPSAMRVVEVLSRRSDGVGSCPLTASASLELTPSRATASGSQTCSPSRTGPQPPAATAAAVARRVVGAAAGAAALVAGPAGALALQALHAQMRVSGCAAAAAAEAAAAADPLPPDAGSSPTQLRLGTDAMGYERGTVAGNAAILWGLAGVAGVAVVLLGGARGGGWRTAATLLKVPGLLYVPYCALAVPTVTAATALLTGGGDGGDGNAPSASDVLLALLGLLTALLPFLALAAMTCTRRFFQLRPYHVRPTQSRHCIAGPLLRWYSPTTEYEDGRGASGLSARWDFAGLADYAKGRQWFGVLELGLGLATGVLGGVASLGDSVCVGINVGQVLATVGLLAAVLVLRPHLSRADMWKGRSSAVLQVAAAGLGVLGRDMTLVCLVAELTLTAVHMAGYMAWAGVGGAARCVALLLRSRRQWHRHRRSRLRWLEEDQAAAAQTIRQQLEPLLAAQPPSVARAHAALSIIVPVLCEMTAPTQR